jgi:hypothetical protein
MRSREGHRHRNARIVGKDAENAEMTAVMISGADIHPARLAAWRAPACVLERWSTVGMSWLDDTGKRA